MRSPRSSSTACGPSVSEGCDRIRPADVRKGHTMTASRANNEKRLREVIGNEGEGRVHRHPSDPNKYVFFVRCADHGFTTKRAGRGNTFALMRARWVLHLLKRHP